jgi:hypothetical protein
MSFKFITMLALANILLEEISRKVQGPPPLLSRFYFVAQLRQKKPCRCREVALSVKARWSLDQFSRVADS